MNAATFAYSSGLSAPGRAGGMVSCMNESSSRVERRPHESMNSEPASWAASPWPLRSGWWQRGALRLVGRAAGGRLRRRVATRRGCRLLAGEDETAGDEANQGQQRLSSCVAHSVVPPTGHYRTSQPHRLPSGAFSLEIWM